MQPTLVSYVLACYNQERYIREALQSAFAQTYSPMEIIVADDCSTDLTFDIAREMAESYKGPHKVILNRTDRNYGIGGNVNRGLALCTGELVLLAAGDDVCLPQRTSIMVQAWNESGRKATSLCSRFTIIDENSRPVGEDPDSSAWADRISVVYKRGTVAGFLRRRKPHVAGCAHAFSRKLITLLGPFNDAITYEDTALCFRTVLLGGQFAFLDAPLVKYRRHGNNVTFALHQARPQTKAAFDEVQRKRRCELDRFVESYKGFAADALQAFKQGLISPAEYVTARKTIRREGRRMELKRELLDCGVTRRWTIFLQLYCGTFRPRETFQHLPFLLPRSIYRSSVTRFNSMRLA